MTSRPAIADWSADLPAASLYRGMAERELAGVSPTYARLCRAVADDPTLCTRLDALPRQKRQPNLLLASVRYLGGPVDTWVAFRAFALDRWDAVEHCIRTHRTQTNEARRLTALLPVLAALPQPLALLEVGASAGLGLFPDRYRYRYGNHRIGADGPELSCAVSGPVPLPVSRPQVVWRRGLDLNPLDVTSDEHVRWLESLIWPEQADRVAVLHGAVEVARADPPRVVAGDLTRDVARVAADAPAGATLVVFHSAVLAYVDEDARGAFVEQVRTLGACWLANEAPGVVAGTEHLRGRPSRFVVTRDEAPLALAGPHGQSLDWLP